MSKITTTTVTATMEPAVTRRRVLLGLGAATATAAALAVPKEANASPAAPSVSIDAFLAKATAAERALYHAGALAVVMGEMHPNLSWRSHINHDTGFALVIGDAANKPQPPIYDGAGFYEVDLADGKRPILWLERFDHESGTGHYFVGAHRWGNRFETAPRRYREKQIRIVRKIEDRRV